jgi:hypothetical protein
LLEIENELLDMQARKELTDAAQHLGLSELDANYERVSQTAKKVGLQEFFSATNGFLSKFAHPTAALVIRIMHQTELAAALQCTCTTNGVDYADHAVMALERMASKIKVGKK